MFYFCVLICVMRHHGNPVSTLSRVQVGVHTMQLCLLTLTAKERVREKQSFHTLRRRQKNLKPRVKAEPRDEHLIILPLGLRFSV